MKTQLSLLVIGILLINACKKDTVYVPPVKQPVASSLQLTINYEVDGIPLVQNAFYTTRSLTDSGDIYNVTEDLKYFLSDIQLIKSDSSKVQICDYLYADGFIPEKNNFTFSNIPDGSYLGLCFYIGVDSAHNVMNGLPSTFDNQAMEWMMMGDTMPDGYHFLKITGNFINEDTVSGYRMHIGTNQCLIKENPIYIPLTFSHSNQTVNMTMNLNEWFRNPYNWSFKRCSDTMMDSVGRLQLAKNGVDVFHLKN